jgi:26S proteasome regulatory subunit T2
MATNRIETLDPALIRPGRIDRKIEFPLPDIATRRMVFRIHTQRMALTDDVDLEEFISSKDDLSGADIKVRSQATANGAHNQRSETTQKQCGCSCLILTAPVLALCPFISLQAICTEAGLLALRERRMRVCQKDFRAAKESALYKKQGDTPEGLFL